MALAYQIPQQLQSSRIIQSPFKNTQAHNPIKMLVAERADGGHFLSRISIPLSNGSCIEVGHANGDPDMSMSTVIELVQRAYGEKFNPETGVLKGESIIRDPNVRAFMVMRKDGQRLVPLGTVSATVINPDSLTSMRKITAFSLVENAQELLEAKYGISNDSGLIFVEYGNLAFVDPVRNGVGFSKIGTFEGLNGIAQLTNSWLVYSKEIEPSRTIVFALLQEPVAEILKTKYGIPLDKIAANDSIQLNPQFNGYFDLTPEYWRSNRLALYAQRLPEFAKTTESNLSQLKNEA